MNTLIYNQGNVVTDNEIKAGYSPVYVEALREDGFAFIQCEKCYAKTAILGLRADGSSQTLVSELTSVDASEANVAVYCPNGAVVYCSNGSNDLIIPLSNKTWDGATVTIYSARYYFNPLMFSNANILITSTAGLKGGFNGREKYVLSQYEAYHVNNSGMCLLNPDFRWLQKTTHVKINATNNVRFDFVGSYNVQPKTEKCYVIHDFNGRLSISTASLTSPYYPVLFRNCSLTGISFGAASTNIYLTNSTVYSDSESMDFYKALLGKINALTSTKTVNVYVHSSIETEIRTIISQAPSNITYNVTVSE